MTTVINKNIVNNLLDKIYDLLGVEIPHNLCKPRGEVTKRSNYIQRR